MLRILRFSPIVAQGNDPFTSSIVPAIVATSTLMIFLLVGVVVLFMSQKYARRWREMLHTERLRAIDSGVPWQDADPDTPERKFMHNAFWISFWIVVFGCGSPFAAVSSAMDKAPFADKTIALAAWCCAAVASIGAAICATVLMFHSRGKSEAADCAEMLRREV